MFLPQRLQVDIDVTRLGLKNQVPLEFGIALHPQGTLTLQLEYVDGQSLFGLDLDSVAERESQRVPLIMQTCTCHAATRARLPGSPTHLCRG